MEDQQVRKALMRLAAAFPSANVTVATLTLYAGALSNLDPGDAEVVIEEAILNARKFPTVADLREAYTQRAQYRQWNRPPVEGPRLPAVPTVPMPAAVRGELEAMDILMAKRTEELNEATT